MPEISQSELNQYQLYSRLGTPDEIQRKIRKLERDNHKQREEMQTLKSSAPKSDQLIITKSDADLLVSYKALGTPDEIKGKLAKGQEAIQTATKLQSKEAAVRFAKAAGIHEDAVDAMLELPALQGAKFEVRKGKVKNEKGEEVEAELPYITMSGENQKAMQYGDAIDTIPALKGLKQADKTPPQGGSPRSWVPQGGDKRQGGETVFDQIRREAAEKNNPQQQQNKQPAAATIEDRLRMTRT